MIHEATVKCYVGVPQRPTLTVVEHVPLERDTRWERGRKSLRPLAVDVLWTIEIQRRAGFLKQYWKR